MASTDHILAVHVYWYFCEGLLITAFTTERDKTSFWQDRKGQYQKISGYYKVIYFIVIFLDFPSTEQGLPLANSWSHGLD